MSVLPLADAKNYLNITETNTDAELQLFIDAAEASLIRKVGPFVPTQFTKRVRGGKSFLFIPITPLISLVSVVPVNGTALDVTKLNPDTAGAVEWVNGGTFPALQYDVTFISGRTTVSSDLLQAIRAHTAHLWKTQQGGARRPGNTDTAALTGAAYAFTYRVNEMIAPHMQGGFA